MFLLLLHIGKRPLKERRKLCHPGKALLNYGIMQALVNLWCGDWPSDVKFEEMFSVSYHIFFNNSILFPPSYV